MIGKGPRSGGDLPTSAHLCIKDILFVFTGGCLANLNVKEVHISRYLPFALGCHLRTLCGIPTTKRTIWLFIFFYCWRVDEIRCETRRSPAIANDGFTGDVKISSCLTRV